MIPHHGKTTGSPSTRNGAPPTAIVWFRRNLRLTDNPALIAALAGGSRILPVYIHAPEEDEPWVPGNASRWWLHHSLAALDEGLRRHGGRLVVRRGPSVTALRRLAAESGAREVHWDRLYEPGAIARDSQIEQALTGEGMATYGHNAALLFEPQTIGTAEGRPYRVFTPFWKTCLRLGLPQDSTPPLHSIPLTEAESLPLETLRLLPLIPWDHGFRDRWRPGETGAQQMLQAFLDEAAADYADGRDNPGLSSTSRLSPHLHFGELSPHQIVAAVRARLAADSRGGLVAGLESFLRELGWREFSHHLLYHFPCTAQHSLDERFEHFPWATDQHGALNAWHHGRTGIPLVDAGMRELWHTGWMHNRVRMVAASFLTKNLLIPWQEGARWFWDTLLDADLANNTQGWQWTAGCGADAAPYFRVFNPVLQSRKFDPAGRYLRRWLPELAALPDDKLHAPWEVAQHGLQRAGVRLGIDYPHPIADLAATRSRALAAYQTIKQG